MDLRKVTNTCGGTTLVGAKLLNRNIIGVDINPQALERCRDKTAFEWENGGQVYIKHGDARNLHFVPNEGVDFICTHPPYANIIQYSEDIDGDLSHYKVKDFLEQMKPVAKECYRVLKKKESFVQFLWAIHAKRAVLFVSVK